MAYETLFSISSMLAMAGWAVLILCPRGWRIAGLAARLGVPLAISALYSALMLVHFGAAEGGFGSLAEVTRLFEAPPLVLAGWTHYLAFDLLVGAWLADRFDAAGLSRILQAPILFMTFMLGPMGFLVGVLTLASLRLISQRAQAST